MINTEKQSEGISKNGPIIPYMSDHGVKTIFTREQPPELAKH